MNTYRSICPISCALDMLGDKWSLLVIRDIVFSRKQYFKDFLASSESISTNVLTDRLRKLETVEIISRHNDPNNAKQIIYRLTEKGVALIPLLLELAYWAGKYDSHADVKPELLQKIEFNRLRLIKDIQRNVPLEAS